MSRRRAYNPPKIQPNLTSMVDVVFILIVFFMLISQINKEQVVDLVLPTLRASTAEPLPAEARVVVNVMPKAQSAGGAYRVGLRSYDATPEGIAAIAGALRAARGRDPSVRVMVRASRDEPYERVHPVLQAVTLAGMSKVDLIALPEGMRRPAAARAEPSP